MFGGYKPDAPDAMRIGTIAKRLAACVRAVDTSRPVTGALAGCLLYTSMQEVNAGQQGTDEANGETTYNTLVSFLGRVMYNYDNRYYLSLIHISHVFFQLTAHLVSVHYRHHNVTDDDVRYFFQGAFLAQLAVGGLSLIHIFCKLARKGRYLL